MDLGEIRNYEEFNFTLEAVARGLHSVVYGVGRVIDEPYDYTDALTHLQEKGTRRFASFEHRNADRHIKVICNNQNVYMRAVAPTFADKQDQVKALYNIVVFHDREYVQRYDTFTSDLAFDYRTPGKSRNFRPSPSRDSLWYLRGYAAMLQEAVREILAAVQDQQPVLIPKEGQEAVTEMELFALILTSLANPEDVPELER